VTLALTATVLAALVAATRQSVIIMAFWTLVGAGVVVSVGAWVLLRREARAVRPPQDDAAPEPSDEREPAGG
jgi:hypothetical protein